MPLPDAVRESLTAKLATLYGDRADEALTGIEAIADRYDLPAKGEDLWDETDAVLITYGDMVRPGDGEGHALPAQTQWLLDNGLKGALSGVHLLPHFPYSSDDGFSVIDYRAVDPDVGDWEDVEAMGEHFDLAFDYVLNHCSAENEWFQAFLRNEEPYRDWFIIEDPDDPRLKDVTRPRTHPLLTPFKTADGTKHVWTTFSADQIDLNFAEPALLVEMLDVLVGYAARGARILRMDAIAYLWKRLGTNCIHLPETHTALKVMRDVLDAVAPGTLILSETNVPHAENISYFGGGDEAHLVYNFSLPPLLLDALTTGDGQYLNAWLHDLSEPGTGMTYFNFTASHDGVGVRPLEGLAPPERLEGLVAAVEARGGQVSRRANADGSKTPYELNCTYFSALGDPNASETPEARDAHVRRFLSSQAVMLALKGIPGIYFHSLVGTPNWSEGVEETGRARTINRRKFTWAELDAHLSGAAAAAVFEQYKSLLDVRRAQTAFHPEAPQAVLDLGPSLVAFARTAPEGEERIACLTNLTGGPVTADLSALSGWRGGEDLIAGGACGERIELGPWQTVWAKETA
ncbi:alpha-amylase family glycosyl hydrolase [Alienimonas chondri]|uniref:Glucosylglycerate phosphorylase n=1 Tax=Alienimonas chondri TaxID=2681879 RepID=A0ABX1VAF1_9PLAN|nr:alpha-amylase family glycosyl hydrolase [Alienimonas chondri]NNJ24709.1 Glucosylglycerate phosphorylase [Alienimonas chondri]